MFWTGPALNRVRLFGLFAFGYFISYVLRGVNNGFAPSLARELHLSAVDLGALTSLYFLGFAAAQIPDGLLLDRYGPRRVNAALLLLGAIGATVFALAPGVGTMMAGRLLIGIGVSATLGSAFTALAQHFSLRQLPLLNGLMMAAGGLGGVAVGAPLSWLLTLADWRVVSVGLAAATALAAVGLWFGAPDAPAAHHRPVGLAESLRGLRQVLGSIFFWRVASFAGVTQGIFYGMQSLWAAAFMRDVSGLSGHQAASLVSLLGIAMMAGNIGFGLLVRRLELHGAALHRFCGAGMALFVLDQALIVLKAPIPAALLWTGYGALGGIGILGFTAMAQYFPSHLIGRANSAFNFVIFLLIFGFQMGVGGVLNQWPVDAGHYPAQAHCVAWAILIGLQIISAAWYFWPDKPQR